MAPEPIDVDDAKVETDQVDSDPGETEPVDGEDTDVETVDPSMVVPEGIELQASGQIACADPVGATDRRWNVRYAPEQVLNDETELRLQGGGIALADFDGNGLLDVFLPSVREVGLRMHAPQGEFNDEAVERLGGIDLTGATGVSVVDFDGDGDLDMFVTRWDARDVLLVNDGMGYFHDGTDAAGFAGVGRSQTSSWGDMDRDGDLDVFIGRYGPRPEDAYVDEEDLEVADRSQLWENLGDGTFLDRSDVIPQDLHDAYTFMSGWFDLDHDGWTELMVINDFGWSRPSRVFWNTPSGLQIDDGSLGFEQPFAGMGLGVADINGDEVFDFVQSSWRATSVLVSNGGAWFEWGDVVGVVPDWEGARQQIFGWGTEMVDLENDGDHDILINYGHWDEYGPQRVQRDAVYVRTPEGNYVDRADVWSMDTPGASRGLVVGDINDDGRIDVVKRVLDERTPMYLSRCNEAAWLRVRLRAPAPNTFAIGARVRVEAGGRSWVRPIHVSGTSMYSSAQPEAHIGLGELDHVDAVEITWPGGEVSRIEHVTPRQILDVRLLD